MDNEKLLSQEMADIFLDKMKLLYRDYSRYLEFYLLVITLFINILFYCFYFKNFGANISFNNFNLGNIDTIYMLFYMFFIIVILFLGNFTQLYCCVDSKKEILDFFIKSKLIFTIILVAITCFVHNINIPNILNVLVMIYCLLYLAFLISASIEQKIFNFFAIVFPFIVLCQDIFIFMSFILFLSKNILFCYKIIILIILIMVCYMLPILSIINLRRNKNKLAVHNKLNFLYSIILSTFIIWIIAPNLIKISKIANIYKPEEIIYTKYLPQLEKVLDENLEKFSCKNKRDKSQSCYEKLNTNDGYIMKNILLLAPINEDEKLYCVILPKDENSSLNNMPKENCLKILPQNENIYIDLKLKTSKIVIN